MKRLLKGLSSALVLALVLVGAPLLLVKVGRLDALGTIEWSQILSVPDDGRLFLLGLTIVAWLAWAVVALSFACELLEVMTKGRISIHPPGTRWLRPVMAVLVVALLGLVVAHAAARPAPPVTSVADPTPSVGATVTPAATSTPSATPTPRTPTPASTSAPTGPSSAPSAQASGGRVGPAANPRHEDGPRDLVVTVQPRDTLWQLAETHYGDPMKWRVIAAANHLDPEEPLHIGQRLTLPGVAAHDERTVTVREGDTLWAIAERTLGDRAQWPRIASANARLVHDPDALEPGWRLVIPGENQTPRQHDPDLQDSSPRDSSDRAGTNDPDRRADRPSRSAPSSSPPTAHPRPSASTQPTAAPSSAGPTTEGTATTAGTANPTAAAGTSSASAAPAPATAPPETGAVVDGPDQALVAEVLAGVTGVLAVGLAGGLAWRRRSQLLRRAPGRRLRPPGRTAQEYRAALLTAAAAAPAKPSGCALGTDPLGKPVSVDLSGGLTVSVEGDDDLAEVLAGIVSSLSTAEDAVELHVTGAELAWLEALDDPELHLHADQRAAEAVLRRCLAERMAEPVGEETPGSVVFVFESPPEAGLAELVRTALRADVGITAVLLDGAVELTHRLRVAAGSARLDDGPEFTPNHLTPPAKRAIAELFDNACTDDTDPAPWWDITVVARHAADAPTAATDILTPAAFAASLPHLEEDPVLPPVPMDAAEATAQTFTDTHPVLLLLGPVHLSGARGVLPSRSLKQCEEYCAWILQHPGQSASAMARSLMVAEGTRRSNVSRLRSWLGATPEGEEYLPDAYSGHIVMHAGVSTDWERLKLLIAPGMNRVSINALVSALSLVRGAPLADAAPSQWHWAEEWRVEMCSTIRDLGVVLAERALAENNIDLARWAAARALCAAPDDELLMCARIRTETMAGNRPEVERLVLAVTRQARALGVDLSDQTVTVLQEAMEGRARARQV